MDSWQMIKLPGGRRRLRVRLVGRPHATATVVWMHGMGGGPRLDRLQHHALADAGFFVVAPELPNHGQSSDTSSFTDMVSMVADGLIAFGVGRPHMVGHSLGGLVVYGMAEHPNLLYPGRLFIAANSPIGPKYERIAPLDLGLRLGLVGADLVMSLQLATVNATLRGKLIPFTRSVTKTLLFPPSRPWLMPGILLQASELLGDAPAKLDAAGICLIRYWGGMDMGVTPSEGACLPGEDRILPHQPHCANFFEPLATAVTADLAAARRRNLMQAA